MAETPVDRRTKHWYNVREEKYEISQRPTLSEWWCAKHPGACPKCGHRLSAHKELDDCERFQEEGHAETLGWDAGQRGHIKANPYCYDDPGEASLWKIYELGYQQGMRFKENPQC